MTRTHYLVSYGPLTVADPPATTLAMNSGGRFPLEGSFLRAERLELAGLIGDGPTAEALRDLRPVVVDDFPWGYRIREVLA
jgi:hypothetical protein